jgi:hypothetical protein
MIRSSPNSTRPGEIIFKLRFDSINGDTRKGEEILGGFPFVCFSLPSILPLACLPFGQLLCVLPFMLEIFGNQQHRPIIGLTHTPEHAQPTETPVSFEQSH